MPLRVNLIGWNNGVGLTRDLRLLEQALCESGYVVHVTAIGRGKLRKWFRPPLLRARSRLARLFRRPPAYDVNIMLEHVRAEDLGSARINLFIPNPEWCQPVDVALLPRLDGVLAKTRHAERLFRELGVATAFIGFTSEDRLDASVPREQRFFHLAGRSSNKGTDALIALWRRHPEWPRLTVLQSPRTARALDPAPANIEHRVDYIDDAELRRLQNACRFHVCCSETEGFGHYLVEAMSVGAVVLTTDAEPMNELVDAGRGVCIPAGRTGRQQLATTYYVDEHALEEAIERLVVADTAHLERLGEAARRWYVDNDRAFAGRLASAIGQLASARARTGADIEGSRASA
ncbi:glycosyltransferase [Lysobacter sp. N42]|uniref:glycosyltransferase n=1 Tax=Lysobacter sp. N42 TaxID=2545719 RepID=UPI001050CAD5|nr:glycosyltransferase [Lysobacter sp. N42]TCZ87753.1 glycosyltransferase [Lysobacter sp. N42]